MGDIYIYAYIQLLSVETLDRLGDFNRVNCSGPAIHHHRCSENCPLAQWGSMVGIDIFHFYFLRSLLFQSGSTVKT